MTDESGVTPAGFVRPRLEDVRTLLQDAFTEEFGALNLDEDDVVGELIGVMSKVLADVWEALEASYFAAYRSSAEGVSLDRAVETIGLVRNAATRTTVPAALLGVEAATISAGARAATALGDEYLLLDDVTIARNSLLVVDFQVAAVIDGVTYTVLLNNALRSVTAGPSDDEQTVAAALAATLASDPLVDVVADGDTVTLTASDGQTAFQFSPQGSSLFVTRLGARGFFEAVEVGAISLPAGALTNIETPRPGWDEVRNLVAGSTGLAVEKDEDLRRRAARSVRVTGSSTVLAIRAKLEQDVDSVVTAILYENRTFETDASGRPPKSFEAIVEGGDNQAIGEKIWEAKPAGIEPFGNTQVVVTDSNSDLQIVAFSRPEPVYVWLKIEIEQYDEEVLPGTAQQGVAAAAVAFGNAQPIGKDVLPQRFFGPIYLAVPGIESMTIRVAAGDEQVSPGDGEFSTDPIPINERSLARHDVARVTVEIQS